MTLSSPSSLSPSSEGQRYPEPPELLEVFRPAPLLVRWGIRVLSYSCPPLARSLISKLMVNPQRFPRPPREDEWLQHAERHEWSLESGRLVFWEWSLQQETERTQRSKANAPVALLVHGWEGRGTQLGGLAGPLIARGWRVIAVDAPGHGESEGSQLLVSDFAKVLLRLGEALGAPKVVIAHSFGALASTLAIRWGLGAERAIFIGAGLWSDGTLDRIGKILGARRSLVEQVLRRQARRAGLSWRALFIEELYQPLQLPLFVIHDREDSEVPFGLVDRLLAVCPQAELLATEGLGHRRILRAPEVVAAIDRWLPTRSAADDSG